MSDNQILYVSAVLCFTLILLSFKFGKYFAIINFIIFFIYSIAMYYGLFYRGEEGATLAWWFYLIGLNVLQILIVAIYLSVKFFKR